MKEWRKAPHREALHRIGVLVNESDVCAGLSGPLVYLMERDITRLVMAGREFDNQAALVASGMAKLTPEERRALGLK